MELSKIFSLHKVFTSHMVLQREKPVIISGNALPGQSVKVIFAEQQITVAANDAGEWFAEFPAMAAGGPYFLEVIGAEDVPALILEDILVGEVWLCSGQSNMEMPVNSPDPFFRVADPEKVMREAGNPQIRFYNSMPDKSLAPDIPLEEPRGTGWQICNAETVADISACGYFFALQLQQDLNVPVGIIATAWGGTDIISWISPEKFKEKNWQFSHTNSDAEGKQNSVLPGVEIFNKWLGKFNSAGEDGMQYTGLNIDDSEWEDVTQNVPLPSPGRYICRFSFDLPEIAGKDIHFKLGIVNDIDTVYLNGVEIGRTGTDTAMYWSVLRQYPVPADCLKTGRNTITVIADNHCGSGFINALDLALLADGISIPIEVQGKLKTLFTLPENFPQRPAPPQTAASYLPNCPNYQSTLSNARLHPWFRYSLRGILWYQGCTNSGQTSYFQLHKMLIDDLREKWHDDKMPFILVQLASFHTHSPAVRMKDSVFDAMPFPEFSAYALTREIQAEMPHVRENVGMITAFDCGDHSDVHPRDKETLGFRLAKKAQSMVYDSKQIADGPEFAGMQFEGRVIRVFFNNASDGLVTSDGKAPSGFVLGDRNGKLYPAKAVIDKNTVVLTSADLIEPQYVRYAFTGYCRVNLCNKAGFPAIPFRSDKPDYEKMFVK